MCYVLFSSFVEKKKESGREKEKERERERERERELPTLFFHCDDIPTIIIIHSALCTMLPYAKFLVARA